jgi:methyl-accepting chemotaxis protein
MGKDPGTGSTPVTGTQDPAQIQRDIEETREELGDTVEALAQKTDVKAQAKQKVNETTASIAEKREQLLGKAKEASPDTAAMAATQASQKARENPLPLAAAAAFAFGFLAGRVSKG